ncbi:DEAD/DEAH box helicase, partial [Candidatus Woesearchaeota archaeon]
MSITYQQEPHSDEETLRELHPIIREWFLTTFRQFSPPQRYAILNIHRGENTLISSPTGSGKTLSAFLAILNNLAEKADRGELENRVYCVYVSPLKALANDITKNLKEPLKEIEALAKKQLGKRFGIRVATRTGDTTANQRASMLKRAPHILITTPESLAICLTTTKFREMLRPATYIIIDEIHALAENKRGVHLSLTIERLEALVTEQRERGLIRIGLSATVHPLREVAQFLVGVADTSTQTYRPCKIVDVQAIKQHGLKVLRHVPDIMRTSHAKQQAAMYELLHELIQKHKTTLIFTNTRSATERV